MKVVLCSVPDGTLKGTTQSLLPIGNGRSPLIPHGPLRISSWMEENGYSGDIYDIDSLRPSDEELIKTFKGINPTVVGLSAPLSICYPNVKRISKILRKLFPDIWIVVGGHLTGSANVVLRKTETDICVVGDGEIPFVKLLDYFKLHPTRRQLDYTELCQIRGLAFIDENNKLKVTGYAEQLPASKIYQPNLDKLRLGLQKYGENGELIHDYFEPINNLSELEVHRQKGQAYSEALKFYEKNKNKKIARIFISRGCVARCTFCQRASKGYRVYGLNELETYIIELKEKYNVRSLFIAEENFGSDRKHTYEIARIMKKHDFFWTVIGARVTSFTYEDFKFYKQHNLIYVYFGIESGSQKILDIMEKKITTKNVYNAILNCKKTSVRGVTDNIIIGMPGETRETIIESAQFVASLRFLLEMDWDVPTTHLAMAIPGTPLYEYCQQIGVIGKTLDEEEDYLIRISKYHNVKSILNYVNKTNASVKEVHYWTYLYRYACKKEYVDLIIKNNKSIKNKLLQIYKQCIKASLDAQIVSYNQRKKSYKNQNNFKKIKHLILPFFHFLLSLSILFLPKAVLFSIIRVYANLIFYSLEKNHAVKKGKQKHNIFTDQPVESAGNFRFAENRITKTNRPIERSLRNIVMENRKQMKPAITDEEIGLQLLAKGQ